MIELSFPGDLTDADELATQLFTTGLSRGACQAKAAMLVRAASALSVTGEAHRGRPPLGFFVPGRIEVLGKHTDYAGGRTMVAAVERGLCVAALPRDDRQMIVIDAASGETIVFAIDCELKPQTRTWSTYPVTVARRMARNFPGAVRGADIAFVSDLPPGGGMGSSSGLITAIFLAMADVNRLTARDEYWHNIGSNTDLAGYLGAVENGETFGTLEGDDGVGTYGGSEDHTAILCAEPNHISQYAFCPVEFEKLIPMPPGYLFVVAASGVTADKSDAAARDKYNAASRLAATLLDLWRRETGRDDPHLAAALGSSAEAVTQLQAIVESADVGPFTTEALLARLEHFMLESGEIIPAAGDALLRGDLREFGRLVDDSQRAAERLLGNQMAETIFLAASARRLGAAAASAFGGGFGGSVWALVETARADDFLAAWAGVYSENFPQHAERASFFATSAGPAAFRVC
ncbi:MAG: galactokinase family protein [Thermoguttaceae bacterium]